MSKQKGAKIIIDCLIEQGVEYVFGYPGGYIIDTFDELYKAKDKITQILTCHEQGACHAADGYARVTGKTGVVMATSGPGACNLVTGIATAYMDSVPLVAITGNVATTLLGRDSFQEVDIAGVTMPVTKHNYIVKDASQLAPTIREAFRIANSGRPGPVLIDVPKDVQQAFAEYEPLVPEKYKPRLSEQDFEPAIDIINEAKRPMLYIGGGCVISGAGDELVAFAEKIGAPVASTVMGLGAFPSSHPLYMGLIGMHGVAGAAKAADECDVLIAVGARFSDRVAGDRRKFAANAKIIHIDIDNAEISKNVAARASLLGDVKLVLQRISPSIKKKDTAEWLKRISELTAKYPLPDSKGNLSPRKILRTVNKMCPPERIIATDVGQHQMWTVQEYRFQKPRTLVTSGGLGTMGFGLGAAIGAAIGKKQPVILITGDGSFHMNLNELATASKLGLPIKIFLFNNGTLGMVRQWQSLFFEKRYSSTTLEMPTRFDKLAEAFGTEYYELDKDADIDTVVKKALASPAPAIVNCKILTDEMVLPMIPAGKPMSDIITDLD